MRRSTKIIGAVVIAGALTAAAGCSSSGSGGSGNGKSITIAGLLSVTGASQVYGVGERDGAQFAVDQANAAGGVGGQKIDFRVVNDNTDVSVDQSRMRELIADNSVLGVVGPTSSSGGVAIKPAIESSGIPVITNVGATAVTEPAIPSLFRVYPRTDFAAAAMIQLMKSKGITRLAIIYADEAFEKSLEAPAVTAAASAGITITADVGYDPNSTNFDPVVLKAKASNPQAYFVPDGSTRLPRILISMNNQGISVKQTPIYGSPQIGAPAVLKVAGTAAEGAIYFSQLAPGDPAPGVQTDFVDAWKKAHSGQLPDDPNELGYSAASALIQAMKKVVSSKKALTRKNIVDALNNDGPFSTPFASLKYTPTNHDGISPTDIRFNVVVNGQSQRYTSTS